jgi:hypothetical protein
VNGEVDDLIDELEEDDTSSCDGDCSLFMRTNTVDSFVATIRVTTERIVLPCDDKSQIAEDAFDIHLDDDETDYVALITRLMSLKRSLGS